MYVCVLVLQRKLKELSERGTSGITRGRREGAAWKQKIRTEDVKKAGNCRIGFKEVIRVGSRGPTRSKFTIVAVCFSRTQGGL